MRVDVTLMQTLACQLSCNSCSRLTRTWELMKLSCKLSLVNSHATLVLVWPGHESWNSHAKSRLSTPRQNIFKSPTFSCCCSFFTFFAFSAFSCENKISFRSLMQWLWNLCNQHVKTKTFSSKELCSVLNVNSLCLSPPKRVPMHLVLARPSSSVSSKGQKQGRVNTNYIWETRMFPSVDKLWKIRGNIAILTCSFLALVSASRDDWMLSCWRLKFFLKDESKKKWWSTPWHTELWALSHQVQFSKPASHLKLSASSSFSANRLSYSCFNCVISSWALRTFASSCSRAPSNSCTIWTFIQQHDQWKTPIQFFRYL